MSDLTHIYFAGVEPPLRRPSAPLPVASGLARIQQKPRVAGQEPSEGGSTDPFLRWLLQEAGLNVGLYRSTALKRRLPACLRALRVATPEAAHELLLQTPTLHSKALNAVLIGPSDFFRDPPVFDCLRADILPELLRTRSGLRVYSAGCSTGQELYSVAILLAECGALFASLLMGVDCRAEAIAHAEAGRFERHELKQLPPLFQERYFTPEGSKMAAVPKLRQQIQWRVSDLAAGDDAGSWDLVLFRNVAIYMNPEHAVALWKRLTALLAPGGVLVTGKAERPPPALPLLRISPCLFRKIES